MFELDSEENKENYPIATDTEFTPDEIEAIKEYKKSLQARLVRKRNTLEVLERGLFSISSYSLARFLILTSGSQGMLLAIGFITFMNNISNRRLLDGVNIDYDEGLKVTGMGKLIRIGASFITTAFVAWTAVGDFYQLKNDSLYVYDQLDRAIEQFNNHPDGNGDWQPIALICGSIAVGAGVVTYLNQKR